MRQGTRPNGRRNLLALPAVVSLAGCLGLHPLSDDATERLDVFDFYWQQIADDYPLFGQRPIDWNELRRRYRAAAPAARAPHQFYHLLTGMLSELNDLHVSLWVPPERFAADGVDATSLLDVPGFRVMPIDGRLHVIGWPLGQAPMPPDDLPAGNHYPELWRVEGFPVVLTLVGNLLQGPPESAVELQLRWRDGTLTRHVLRRPPQGTALRHSPLGHLGSERRGFHVRRNEPWHWISVDSFADEAALAGLDAAIDDARHGDGLVLDMRRNQGGLFRNAQRLAERFLNSPVPIVYAPPHPESRWFGLMQVEYYMHEEWVPREPRFDRPLVVLTSVMTGSAAEHTARILQRYAGATLIGERTAGAETVVQSAIGPDGAELTFGSMRVLEANGAGLQTDGVVPDVAVRLDLDSVEALGADAAVTDWERRLREAVGKVLERQNRNQNAVR